MVQVSAKVASPNSNASASQAGVSKGVAVWLHACRNSAVSLTPAYAKAVKQVQAVRGGRQDAGFLSCVT